VIEFLTAEGSSPIEIHRLLRSMYVSSDRWWVHCFESRGKGIGDTLQCLRATAIITLTRDQVDALIQDDFCITRSEHNKDWKIGNFGHHNRTWLESVLGGC
jgi:hypothetical protein